MSNHLSPKIMSPIPATKDDLDTIQKQVNTNEDNITMAQSDIESLTTDVGALQASVQEVTAAVQTKANITDVVDLTSAQAITGTKTFSAIKPSKVSSEGDSNFIRCISGAKLYVTDTAASSYLFNADPTNNQVSCWGNVALGSTAAQSGAEATSVWVNGQAEFYTSLNMVAGAPAHFYDVTFWQTQSDGSLIPGASFNSSTGETSIYNLSSSDSSGAEGGISWQTDSRESTYGMHLNKIPLDSSGNVTLSGTNITRTSTLADDDNSNEIPTTAWVTKKVNSGGGSLPDNITCKSLEVTEYQSDLTSIGFAGNLKYTGDTGNGSLGTVSANRLESTGGYFRFNSGELALGGVSSETFLATTQSQADGLPRVNANCKMYCSETPSVTDNSTQVVNTAYINKKFQTVSTEPAEKEEGVIYFVRE